MCQPIDTNYTALVRMIQASTYAESNIQGRQIPFTYERVYVVPFETMITLSFECLLLLSLQFRFSGFTIIKCKLWNKTNTFFRTSIGNVERRFTEKSNDTLSDSAKLMKKNYIQTKKIVRDYLYFYR